MTADQIEDIMIHGLEGIADDLSTVYDVLFDENGDGVEGVTMPTLDMVLKRQFKRMQEILNECI